MHKIVIIFLLLFWNVSFSSFAQIQKQLDSLHALFETAVSDSQKVMILGTLADHYYIYGSDSLAGIKLHQQLMIAELSNNPNLMLTVLFGDAINNIGYAASSKEFDRTINFIERGIEYAKSKDLNDFITLGYVRLSNIQRRRGEYEQSLSSAVLALTSMANVSSDSIKALTYIELGNIYMAKGEPVKACENYNHAFDIAAKEGSVALQSQIHHLLAEMYGALGDSLMAMEELNKSRELNKIHKYGPGLTHDFYNLARYTDEKIYIENAIRLADSLQLIKYKLSARRLMLVYYQVIDKDHKKALYYLEHEPDLKQSYLNAGIENYYIVKANSFFYAGMADSALKYYLQAEHEILQKSVDKEKQIIFLQLAEAYLLQRNAALAIEYFLKIDSLGDNINNLETQAYVFSQLSSAYEAQGDYKNAFLFSKKTNEIRLGLEEMTQGREIALMGVSRENLKHELEQQNLHNIENKKRNIHYMLITLAIVVVFFIMLVVGSFPISKTMIRLMGYFFFISLFEFFILIIDHHVLIHYLHNQPLKIWLIKIGLIAMLVPFQHFLEKKVTGFLESRALIKAWQGFSIKKWFQKQHKPEKADVIVAPETSV